MNWLDNVNADLRENRLSGEEAKDRVIWRRLTSHIDPSRVRKGEEQ